jgi:hypothetical protein
MNSEVRSIYRCFRRVEEFLAAHNLDDASANLGKQAIELKDVMEQLSREALDQEAGFRFTKAQTKHQRQQRKRLWERHMLPVSRVARDVFGLEGMDRALRMPRMSSANERVVAAAGAMAEAAERQQSVFLEHGLAPDFIVQLRSAAAELATAMGSRDGNQRRLMEATRNVRQLMKRGKRALRLLNAILQVRLADEPSRLAAWNTVRAVKDAGGGSTASPPAPLVVEAPAA